MCVRAVAQMSDGDEANELHAALEDWVAASNGGDPAASVKGVNVTFRSCDPGSDAEAVGDIDPSILQLPILRTQVYAAGIEQGLREDQARCYADEVMDLFSSAELVDPSFRPTPAQEQAIVDAAVACR